MDVQSKNNDLLPTSSGTSSDEFFEANSSLKLSVIDDKNDSLEFESKVPNNTSTFLLDNSSFNKSNLKNKKSTPGIRKNSNTSNQSTISLHSNKDKDGVSESNQKKNSKKSSSSSTFSKIQMFRDRSNTKKSNNSSDAVLTDSTTNNVDGRNKRSAHEPNIFEDNEI